MLNKLVHEHSSIHNKDILLRKELILDTPQFEKCFLGRNFLNQIQSNIQKYMEINYLDKKFIKKRERLLKCIYNTVCFELDSRRKIDVFEMMQFVDSVLQNYRVLPNYIDHRSSKISKQSKAKTISIDFNSMIESIYKLKAVDILHNRVLDAVLGSLETKIKAIDNPKFRIEKTIKRFDASNQLTVVGYRFSDDSIMVNSKYILPLYTIGTGTEEGIKAVSTLFLREQGHAEIINSQSYLDLVRKGINYIVNKKYGIEDVTKGISAEKVSEIIDKLKEVFIIKGMKSSEVAGIINEVSDLFITDKQFISFMEAGASLYLINKVGSWGCMEATSVLLYAIYLKLVENESERIPEGMLRSNIKYALDDMGLNKLYPNESTQTNEFKRFIKSLSDIYPKTKHILNNIPIDTKYMADLVKRRIEDLDGSTNSLRIII